MSWGQRITIKLYGNTIHNYTLTHLRGLPFAVFQNFRQRKDWRPKREKEPLQHFKGIMSRQQTLEKRETVRRQTTVNWFPRKTIFYTSSIHNFQYKYCWSNTWTDMFDTISFASSRRGKKSILKCHGICDLIFLVFYSCTHSASSEQEEASLLFLLSSFFCKFPHVPDKGRVDRGKKRNAIENEGLICRANSCEKESVSRLLVFERLTQLFLLA